MGANRNPAQSQKARRPYRCFLVRCWLEEGSGAGGEPGWRFSVKEARDGERRRSFAHLKEVAAYLDFELGSSVQHPAEPAERS